MIDIYHTPAAKSIDAIVLQDDILLVIQITTANPPNPSKKDALQEEMEIIAKILLKIGKIQKIRGWFISLYDFESEVTSKENLVITAGKQLQSFFGEKLYAKLKEVKISFSE